MKKISISDLIPVHLQRYFISGLAILWSILMLVSVHSFANEKSSLLKSLFLQIPPGNNCVACMQSGNFFCDYCIFYLLMPFLFFIGGLLFLFKKKIGWLILLCLTIIQILILVPFSTIALIDLKTGIPNFLLSVLIILMLVLLLKKPNKITFEKRASIKVFFSGIFVLLLGGVIVFMEVQLAWLFFFEGSIKAGKGMFDFFEGIGNLFS